MEKYTMASQAVTSGAAKNNGSTIVNAGNVASDSNVNAPSLGTIVGAFKQTPTGVKEITGNAASISTVSEDDVPTATKRRGSGKIGVQTAKGSGTFAYNNQRGIMRRVNSTINNVANTTLQSGGVGKGARTNSAIGGLESYRSLPEYTFNSDGSIVTVASAGGVSKNYIDPAQAGGSTASSDSAANPTRAIPGELVYTDSSQSSNTNNTGLGVPKQDDYKAKTG
jgi:hypothetical protein